MESNEFKPGLLAAGIGGVILLLSTLFDWYSIGATIAGVEVNGGGLNAFDSPGFLGAIADLLIVAAAIAAIALSVLSFTGAKLPLPGSAIIAVAGVAAAVLVFGRMIFQPGTNEFVSLEAGIFIALIASVAIAVGGFLSMKDEGATFDQARDQLRATAKQASASSQQSAPPAPAPTQAPPQPPPEQPPPTQPPGEQSQPPPPQA